MRKAWELAIRGKWFCLPGVKDKVKSGRKERLETKDYNVSHIPKEGGKEPC